MEADNIMDNYPIDYTGYGPSSSGNAPNSYDMERQLRYQMHTNRNAMAMQHIDPYIRKGAEKIVGQLTTGGANTPEEARRVVYSTARGQMSLDAITAARRSGVLGYGDPMAYAAKIQAGVAGGGFDINWGGSQGAQPGQVFGSNQSVSGQGVISERVSQQFMRSIMQGVYGKDNANPDNFHGIDMEGTGTIFQHIAKRGGLGSVATIKRNASLTDKIKSAKNNELDQTIVDNLSKVDLSSEASAEASLDALMGDDTVDDKTKNAIKSIKANPNAMVFNEENSNRIKELVKSIGSGVASVMDIYENLSTGEAITKLEEVSGMRIRDKATAKAAEHSFEKLRNTARSAGIDEQVFMEMYGANSQQTLGQVMQTMGLDSRTLALGKQANAVINQDAMNYGVAAHKYTQKGLAGLNEAGFEGLYTPDAQAIIEDRQAGNVMAAERFDGVALAQGSLRYLRGEKKERAQALLDKFYASGNIEDMTANSNALKGMMTEFYGGESGLKGQAALVAKTQGLDQKLLDKTQEERQRGINLGAPMSVLGDMGITDKSEQRDIAEKLAFSLGSAGINAVMESSNNDKLSGEDRQNKIRESLRRAEISDDSGFYERFFDESGRLKDAEGFEAASAGAINSNRGHVSKFSQLDLINDQLDQYGAHDNRKLKGGGGFLKNLATGFLSGDIKGFDDHTFMMMAQEIGQGSILDGAATGVMNFQNNDKEGLGKNLEQMDKLMKGGDLGAYKKLGYESREEMIAAMSQSGLKGKEATNEFMELLNSDSKYANLKMTGGGIDSLQFYDQEKLGELREQHGEEYNKRKDDMMSLTLLAPAFSEGFYKEKMEKLKGPDGTFDLEGFDAAEIYRGDGDHGFMQGDGQASFSRIYRQADAILNMSAKDLGQLDKSGDLQKAHDHHLAQANKLRAAKKEKGIKTVDYQNPDGSVEKMDIDKAIQKNALAQAKIEAYQNGEQFVGTMRVQTLHIEEKKE